MPAYQALIEKVGIASFYLGEIAKNSPDVNRIA
jgi:hypothetical protein